MACAGGCLELNPFLPLIAACLLESIDLLTNADDVLARHCIDGLEADEARCRQHVESSTAFATALLPALGYERCADIVRQSKRHDESVRQTVRRLGLLTDAEMDALTSPEAVCRLGTPTASNQCSPDSHSMVTA
jgi:aspartate ammonia-lyase